MIYIFMENSVIWDVIDSGSTTVLMESSLSWVTWSELELVPVEVYVK